MLGVSAVRSFHHGLFGTNNRGSPNMKLITTFAVALGIASLAACNQAPQEQAADNIEENAEATADMLEENAGEGGLTEDNAENAAEAVREGGEANADATREGADADGNSAN
jgi:hypothetical protein